MTHVCLSGRVSDYGPKISWTEAGKPQTTFSLVVEEPGRDGSTTYKTFVPVCVVGAQAEAAADIEAGALVIVTGKLAYHKAGKTKDAGGKLVVTCFTVEVLAHVAAAAGGDDAPPNALHVQGHFVQHGHDGFLCRIPQKQPERSRPSRRIDVNK